MRLVALPTTRMVRFAPPDGPNAPLFLCSQLSKTPEQAGPTAGLTSLKSLDTTVLDDYQPYHAARADLLARAGQRDEAVAAYDRAIALTTNATEREFLKRQRRACRP